jgi:hypothetical protein
MQYFKPFHDLNESILERQPALEYPRIADSVLRGIFEGLIEEGYTEDMATSFITSSILRHELDGNLEDGLADFGKFYARTIANSYRSDCKRYAEQI